ncbi:MAG: L,D-transpeptidase family protein [Pseudomonadota bacterium]
MLTRRNFTIAIFAAALALTGHQKAGAQTTAFKQAVAEAAAPDRDIAEFYRSTGYDSFWTGKDDRARRNALIDALENADHHGLPSRVYDLEGLRVRMASARSARDLGVLEVALSQVFLTYARDVQTGLLTPSQIDPLMVRKVPLRKRASYLTNLSKSSPKGFFRALPPQTAEYNALMKHKLALKALQRQGGWGAAAPARTLKPGATGSDVVALRDRLVRMGYMNRSASQSYDATLEAAVRQFQARHGLAQDGVAGPGTLAEISIPVASRLQSVAVAMERERWMNLDRGQRHIDVNLADFSAKIIDNGKVTFATRSVIGHRERDRQSPEFSDVMEFLVINPSWHVPRSIATKEYLPELQQDPMAVSHLEITDSSGRQVDRLAVDFTQYTTSTFPFAMRQPPSRSNALGLVKFMFPNKHNIYLHDTPQKKLFAREVRAYSHGCIRLADPFEFAYALLAKQTSNPEDFFQRILATGEESTVYLEQPVPVHLMYRTALTDARGALEFRRDIYGRDDKIWRALDQAGVALKAAQG